MHQTGPTFRRGDSHVLVVDDDPQVLATTARRLERAGFGVERHRAGEEAVARLGSREFDAIVTDISMPGLDGIELLRRVREHDRDIPVLLVTGNPSLETAASAVDLGAFKYLFKPYSSEDLVQSVTRATQLCRLARTKRAALALLGTGSGEASDRAGLEASFAAALESLWVAFQPIVDVSNRSIFGYEALMRSDEPSLPHPGAVLDAAERLGALNALGRTIRERAASHMRNGDPTWLLFLNLHPEDLMDDHLLDGGTSLSAMASRVILEITERASLDRVPDVRARVTALRGLGFRIAIDDLGAGYAGLSSFVHLQPDFVKLDMSLVRGVHENAVKSKLVGSMTRLCRELGLQIVAEGIETPDERDTLVELGCDLLQGYRFAKPGKPFVEAGW